MVGGLVTKATTSPPGTPPSHSPPPPTPTLPEGETLPPSDLTSSGDDEDLETCPHGVAWVPPGRSPDVVTCMLCKETRDDVGTTMMSQGRPPRVRRAATLATTGIGTLEAVLEREEMPGGAVEGVGGGTGRTGEVGISKTTSVPAIPSHELHSQSSTTSCYSVMEGSITGHGQGSDVFGPDLRRTQSLKSLFCLPGEELVSHDHRLRQAHACPRVSTRRNALNDPFKMPMPQETRERIQRETQERKTNVKLRVSRYFRSLVDDEPEVDLI